MSGAQSNFKPDLFDREVSVVGGGLKDGMASACVEVWSDMQAAAGKLAHHPIQFVDDLVKNHWEEPLVGAAITFANPRGLANIALLAFSARGLLGASFKAVKGAASDDADVDALKKAYTQAVSHEGSAFLVSMPLTMAGGMVGRSAANAIFGQNLGAWDMITKKVSPSTVADNWWNIRDNLKPPEIALVVTDVDNTLFPFNKSCALGMEPAIKDLALKTGMSEDSIYESLGSAMKAHGSFNYPWAVELALADKLNVGKPGGITPEEFRSTYSDPFWATLEQSLRDNGKAFPTVVPGMEAVKARGKPVALLTNATPIALKRVDSMGLSDGQLVDSLYAMQERPAPDGLSPELLQHGKDRLQGWYDTPHAFPFTPLPREFLKPSGDGLLKVVKDYGLRPKQVLMVGDSAGNDIGAAKAAGTLGLLINYEFTTPAYEGVLDRLSSVVKNKVAGAHDTFVPEFPWYQQTDSFANVADFLNPKANYGAIFGATARALLVKPEITSAFKGYGFTRNQW